MHALFALALVTGTVTDSGTDAPIAGAVVSVQATDISTVTDASGDFTLDADGIDLVIVAGAKGYWYASTVVTPPDGDVGFQLEPVDVGDDPDYVFSTPAACGVCHDDQRDEWQGSPMAEAGVNTWVHDIYAGNGTSGGMGGFVYVRDSPHAIDNPESECAACHEPESWIAAPHTAMSDPADPPATQLHGVSCDVCHKISDVDTSKPNFPGFYPGVATVSRPAGVPRPAVQYGVLGDVTFESANLMRASYQPQLRSEVCALCHQDKNDPDNDGDFEEDDGVISEPTYLEWLGSAYADPESPQFAECVDCHMPATGRTEACTALPDGLGRPADDVRSHAILGTTAAFLENAVTMDVLADVVGDAIEVDVSIANDQTGHHVPTGVTIRNMILVVEASRAADDAPLVHTGDQVVHDLGGVGDPADGYYAGLAGKLYGKVNHDADGNGPVFFTDATGIQFDSRIPALATDTTSYTFEAPAQGGEVTVRARLIYRRSWRALVDAKGWTEDGHGTPLADIAAPHFGHLMEEAELVVVAPATGADAGPGGTDGDGGCGCRSSGGQGATSLLAVVLGLMLGVRRRRQRA